MREATAMSRGTFDVDQDAAAFSWTEQTTAAHNALPGTTGS